MPAANFVISKHFLLAKESIHWPARESEEGFLILIHVEVFLQHTKTGS